MKAIKNWQRYVLEWGILAALIVFILVSHVIGGGTNQSGYILSVRRHSGLCQSYFSWFPAL